MATYRKEDSSSSNEGQYELNCSLLRPTVLYLCQGPMRNRQGGRTDGNVRVVEWTVIDRNGTVRQKGSKVNERKKLRVQSSCRTQVLACKKYI